jgi:hypothetical protein
LSQFVPWKICRTGLQENDLLSALGRWMIWKFGEMKASGVGRAEEQKKGTCTARKHWKSAEALPQTFSHVLTSTYI